MDLATPLQPTSILIAPTQECERSLVTDPSWIPLPPSPRSLSPGPLINWSPPPGSGQPSSHEKLMQVSGKLERAKSQLDEKEILLAELRADMENLQQQILSRK
ncbi:hypothetical protein SERLA73DRAFT_168316 [Serpula lacrymans var. lacrymans S7.3]|uniref:Uncharacterized protein n=2 Tax=Serpula lacrymans var. lacrymans TaxID=341189 RepID=F8PXT0_SERL3|nr:hypothetical protein SERLA73DRAFT_168316 [Serpula lacrymans var. lacrymans S7.3]